MDGGRGKVAGSIQAGISLKTEKIPVSFPFEGGQKDG
jgi:hypothetical protein